MKLSIIVPVFNMAGDEKLTYCLNSLLGQKLNDYEIITVDDCSTDNSLEILKEYEQRHPDKIRVIHSEINKHQGGAKNIGMQAARGEWIGFIDADDWIHPDMYNRMISRAEETGADMVGCDLTMVDSHTMEVSDIIEKNGDASQTGILDHDKKKHLILDGGRLVTKIYKRDTLQRNDIHFPENIFYEDNAMSNSFLLTAQHYEHISEPWYYYYQHDASTVHSFSERKCLDRMEAGRIILSEAKRLGFYEEFKDEIEFMFIQLFFVNTLFTYMPCVRPTKLSFVKELTNELLNTYPEFEINRYYKDRVNPEEKKLIKMLCNSPLRFYAYYKLLWTYRKFRRLLSK